MITTPAHVSFKNKTNPKARFEMLQLEELLQREVKDHNPEVLHKVEFFIVLMITDGNGYHTIDFTDYKYQKGTVFTIRKDQLHKFFRNTTSKGKLLLFTDEFLVSYLGEEEAQKAVQIFNEFLSSPKLQLLDDEFTELLSICERIENEYFHTTDNYSLAIIRSELHILLLKLGRIQTRQTQTVKKSKYITAFIQWQELVEQHVFKTTRVADYAKMMGVSTKTLNNIAQDIVNKNAKDFIDDVAIKQIKRLLIHTDFSVKEVAYLSGFDEVPNFYKYFKRKVGVTPEQFRSVF